MTFEGGWAGEEETLGELEQQSASALQMCSQTSSRAGTASHGGELSAGGLRGCSGAHRWARAALCPRGHPAGWVLQPPGAGAASGAPRQGWGWPSALSQHRRDLSFSQLRGIALLLSSASPWPCWERRVSGPGCEVSPGLPWLLLLGELWRCSGSCLVPAFVTKAAVSESEAASSGTGRAAPATCVQWNRAMSGRLGPAFRSCSCFCSSAASPGQGTGFPARSSHRPAAPLLPVLAQLCQHQNAAGQDEGHRGARTPALLCVAARAVPRDPGQLSWGLEGGFGQEACVRRGRCQGGRAVLVTTLVPLCDQQTNRPCVFLPH